MSKNKNSKTQSEGIAEFDAARVENQNAENDPIPPVTETPSEKRTRKNRPVILERKAPGQDEPADWRAIPDTAPFSTESAAWEYAESAQIEGTLRLVIVLDTRTATVETVKKVKWA